MFPGKLGPIMSEGTQFSGTLEEERIGYAWNDNCGLEKMFNSSKFSRLDFQFEKWRVI